MTDIAESTKWLKLGPSDTLRMAIRDLTRLLLRFLHARSEKTHQLPLFNDGQLTAGKHVGSAAGHLCVS